MILNAIYWSQYFAVEFVPQLRGIVDALEKRVLPAFDGLEEESQRIADNTWKNFMSKPGTGNEDPTDFAELAQESGVTHYILLIGIQQGIINLFATALYHAFEQQVMLFHRREMLHTDEENKAELFNLRVFQQRLLQHGIDITQFSSWQKVQELRLIANAVKHGEGGSAKELYTIRPELFVNPSVAKLSISKWPSKPSVFQPLVGEDIYVSLEDIKIYREALIAFWEKLGCEMERD